MRFLLDTHTFIWTLSDPLKIPDKARLSIEAHESDVYISSVSFWEIAIKVRNGRLAPIGDASESIVAAAERLGFVPIPLEPGEAASSKNLVEDTHFDPFDRMLISQAIQRDLILISADRSFDRFAVDGLRLLWR